MAISSLTSRTVVSTSNKVSFSGRTVIQPTTWYLCPAGKRGICKGTVQCTGRGAATVMSFRANGNTMYSWVFGAVDGNPWELHPNNLQIGAIVPFEATLEAGEIIETTQNSGTNAEFNVWGDVVELPA